MDHLNDHLVARRLQLSPADLPLPKRHSLRCWTRQASAVPARRQFIADAPAGEPSGDQTREPSDSRRLIQRLAAGQAVTLRAKALSVLHIAHGRVWVTLTNAWPYSRVIAGDHFLNRGDTLTLLPGQALVMEPFGRGEKTSAQFTWGLPGAVAAVTPAAATANWRGGVLQPLLDMRHASGVASRAMGRLLLGLGHAAAAEAVRAASYVAIIFVADYARKSAAESTFDTTCKDSAAFRRLY